MKNIDSYLPVFPGFYETIFQADEDYIIEAGKTYDDYEFNYTNYETEAAKACVCGMETQLNKFGFNLAIEFQAIASPAYYNYSNDNIHVAYKLKRGCIQAIRNYLKDNLEAFQIYLKDNYTTCSGFISWHSNDPLEWLTYANFKGFARDGHYLGAMLSFVCTNEGYDYWALYYDSIDRYDVRINGWLKEVAETETEETDLGAIWKYVPFLEQSYNYIFNPNQLTLSI